MAFAVMACNVCLSQKMETDTTVKNTTVNYVESNPENAYWIYIGKTVSGDEWYIRSQITGKGYNGTIKLWTKTKMPTTTFSKKIYRNAEEKTLIEVDCKGSKAKGIATVLYDSNGNVIDSHEYNSPQFENIIPDSIMEDVKFKACLIFN